jgi:DNA-binding MarR family transcriptional regulator
MRINGGFQVSKIKQLGDRIFEKILAERDIEAFNGAQGRILYVLFQEDGVPIKTVAEKCGLAITSLTTMLERMEKGGLILRKQDPADKRKTAAISKRSKRRQKRLPGSTDAGSWNRQQRKKK